MGLGTFIWNATEYACYLSIIVHVAMSLGLDQLLGIKRPESSENEGLETGMLAKGMDMLGSLVKNLDLDSDKKNKTGSTSRKK